MRNTKGDVALTNISRETNYLQYPKQKFFAFPQPRTCFSTFLNFGHFQPYILIKKVLIKKE